jgi:uncharacterized OB-fold protein
MDKKRLLVGENLFCFPDLEKDNGKPRLIGSKCRICGEVVFPQKTLCPNCCSDQVEKTYIGPKGTLYSYTVIYKLGPLGYKGPVPYGVAKVEMPEGLRITGYTTECDPDKFRVGMEMELIVDKLFVDENENEVIGFKFKPVE